MTRVLLVHGAFHGAWCWDRLVPELTSRHVDAEAVELPFLTPAGDAEVVTSAIGKLSAGGEKVVAVGHSFGGSLLSRAAGGADHLVYLTAVMVAPGETPQTGKAPGVAALSYEGETAGVDPAKAVDAFYHRCAPEDAAWAVGQLRPMPTALFAASAPEHPAWEKVPSTYVICTDDRIIDPTAQTSMARHAGSVISLDSDHSPFLACPGQLADLLAEVVAAV